MEVKIVLGYTFGDEGKGVTTQWLCNKAIEEGKKPVVVRFSGGPQAGHTIVRYGNIHVCSSFGSGVFLNVPTYLNYNVYVDPISLVKELRVLNDRGYNPKITINQRCRVITPYDVLAGRKDSKVLSDGTCGKGIFNTFKRYNDTRTVQPQFYACSYEEGIEQLLDMASSYNKIERDKEYDWMFKRDAEKVSKFMEESPNTIEDFDVIIFEGSQGLLLDMNCGFFPNVTPSMTGLGGIEGKYLQDAEVYLVSRTYTTRHGNGYIPKYKLPWDLSDKFELNECNEFQGEFKVGCLEVDLLNRASERHRLDNYMVKYNLKYNLVLTHMDLPMDNMSFSCYCGEKSVEFIGGGLKPAHVVNWVSKFLNLPFNKFYYNDSPRSEIKEIT